MVYNLIKIPRHPYMNSFRNRSRPGMARTWVVSTILISGMLATSACGTSGQYKKVAKEWALSMRAQQMIPVYPISEDLRPGDVFLVSASAASEADRYESDGFLSLDDHRARLPGLNYTTFYTDGFFKNTYTAPAVPPAADQSPTPAPRVVFPSYTFTVKKGVAGGLGLPVSGIPLALSYSGAKTATGSVTITDASTYAIDQDQLYSALAKWLRDSPERTFALGRGVAEHGHRAKDGEPYLILRVIQRVYLARAVDVSLTYNSQSHLAGKSGSTGSSGASAPDTANFAATLPQQQALLSTLNTLASQAKIGGELNFKSFTSRGVSLTQRFDRPLVLGYLGLDVPIFADGSLGAPVPTYQRLREPRLQSPSRIAFTGLSLQLDHLETISAAADYDRALRIVTTIVANLPGDTLSAKDKATLNGLADEARAAKKKTDAKLYAQKVDALVVNFSAIATARASEATNPAAIQIAAALRSQLSPAIKN